MLSTHTVKPIPPVRPIPPNRRHDVDTVARWLMVGLLLLIFLHSHGWAQGIRPTGNTVMRHFNGAPSGSCLSFNVAEDDTTGDFYDCFLGSWFKVNGTGGTGGSGTVTSFSAGNLSPLFTTSVATSNSTPALTFALSNAAAHTFFGNSTSSSAAPAFSSITAADLPGVLAQTLTNASHKWLNSYDSSTGLFTQTQPAYSDISGTPTLPATLANASQKWFNSYDSTTGLFTQTQPAYSDISGTPQLAVTKTCTGTDKVSAYDSTTGLFTCSTDQTGAGGSTPTGTGFTHITGGAQDAAAKTVDVSSADITGVLASADFPALTGDVTNSAGSLATTIASSAVTRAKEAASGKGWEFIGTCTVNPAAATCPITFSGTARKHGQCDYYIAGYAGGGGIAMVNFNSDTGSNYNRTVGDNSATPTQTNATTGIRVSNTTTTNERFGRFEFFNVSAIKKFVVGHGTTLGSPTATGPNENNFSGWWTNVAGLATSIQLGNAGVNLNANSTMTCWARDDD